MVMAFTAGTCYWEGSWTARVPDTSFIPGRVTVQLYSRPFSSFIPGRVTVQLYSRHFQLYSQPCYCTALFLAMLLFSIIQVLFPTVLPYSFIPGHLFAVHGLFITVNNSHLFAVCRLFIAVKTIIICLLLFGSAQWEWGHLVNPQLCQHFYPLPAPVAISAVTLALSDLKRRYTQYECGRMQPLLWSRQWSQVSSSRTQSGIKLEMAGNNAEQ
jgi:hypothetical protein